MGRTNKSIKKHLPDRPASNIERPDVASDKTSVLTPKSSIVTPAPGQKTTG